MHWRAINIDVETRSNVYMCMMGWGRVVSRAEGGKGGPIVYVLFVPSVFMTRDCASSKELTQILAIVIA